MHQSTRDLTVTLTPDEANAAVEAISLAVTNEAEMLGGVSSDSPGDLWQLGRRAARIGTYAELGEALKWRKHWGSLGGTPEPVTPRKRYG